MRLGQRIELVHEYPTVQFPGYLIGLLLADDRHARPGRLPVGSLSVTPFALSADSSTRVRTDFRVRALKHDKTGRLQGSNKYSESTSQLGGGSGI